MYRTLRTLLFAVGLLLAAHFAKAQIAVKMAVPASGTAVAPSTTSATSSLSANGDETLLRSVGIATDGPGLLTYFRLRSRGQANPERLAALIAQLGAASPIAARKACGELAGLGAPAIPALRRAVKDPDRPQTVRLARRCLQALERHPGQLSSAAARLIGERRPPGAAETLLAFLPYAEDEGVIEEIRLALAEAVRPDGKPDPALLRALHDDSSIRRALAIDTLCQNGITTALLQQVPLDKLLYDPKPSVRLRAALALARAYDAKAVSTLITLLTELPLAQARQAEEYLVELADKQAPKALLGSDKAARRKCRAAWAAWWQASEDSDRLLHELRKRTMTESVRQQCTRLIEQLGDADFHVREKAQTEVKAMGALVLPLLRRAAAKHPDLEIRKRARDSLREMERVKDLPLSPLVPRLIGLREPAGAAEALLAYVPYADEDAVRAEVQLALNAVAFQHGKPEPAVIRALSDSQGARRAAAAEALCLGGDRAHLPIIRKMLDDSVPAVRLQAALALAGISERRAVPVLIELLGELPSAQAEPAEEYLQRLAGDDGPQDLPSGDDDAARKKRQKTWARWWKANGDRVALVDRYPPPGSERYLGHILLIIANPGEIIELGRDRKELWKIKDLKGPRDVQVLGKDRILIAEWSAHCVSERNRKGDVIWQKQINGSFPLSAQRLRNGHTFIVCNNKLLEVDRGGNEIFSINRPDGVVMARRLRNGQIVLVSNGGQCIRMDASGKQLKSFALQMLWQTGVNILPNGHIIVPEPWVNRVTEYDTEGKTAWQAKAMSPISATRLRNGNALIAQQNRWPPKVIETDPSGKQVSEISVSNFPFRIRTR